MIAALAERSIVYGVLAAICFLAGWKVNGWRLGEGIAEQKADAVTAVRVVERKDQSTADLIGASTHEELEQARRDASAAVSSAIGLQSELRNTATRLATCNASTSAERQARERAAAVLANVLESMERRGRDMAEVATRSRASGLACEQVYDGVRVSREKPR